MEEPTLAPTRHRLTVDDFARLGTAGILNESDRVELLDGQLIDLAPIDPGHAGIANRLNHALVPAFDGRGVVAVCNPVRLGRYNELLPDVAILRHRHDFYTSRHPEPPDVLPLIEVANSSLAYDRGRKLPLYAKWAIPEVWIIDVARRRLEAYRSPSGDTYAETRTLDATGTIRPAAAPDIEIPLARILA